MGRFDVRAGYTSGGPPTSDVVWGMRVTQCVAGGRVGEFRAKWLVSGFWVICAEIDTFALIARYKWEFLKLPFIFRILGRCVTAPIDCVTRDFFRGSERVLVGRVVFSDVFRAYGRNACHWGRVRTHSYIFWIALAFSASLL